MQAIIAVETHGIARTAIEGMHGPTPPSSSDAAFKEVFHEWVDLAFTFQLEHSDVGSTNLVSEWVNPAKRARLH